MSSYLRLLGWRDWRDALAQSNILTIFSVLIISAQFIIFTPTEQDIINKLFNHQQGAAKSKLRWHLFLIHIIQLDEFHMLGTMGNTCIMHDHYGIFPWYSQKLEHFCVLLQLWISLPCSRNLQCVCATYPIIACKLLI